MCIMNNITMSLEMNAENRNRNLMIRCCSFCRRPGHNITSCNSEPLGIFESSCLMCIGTGLLDTSINPFVRFHDYLLNEALRNPDLVRAFAIRKCGSTTRSNMDVCIERIIQYFTPNLQQGMNQIDTAETIMREYSERHLNRRTLQEYISLIGARSPQTVSTLLLFMHMIINMRESVNESISNNKFNIEFKNLENKSNINEIIECGICYDELSKNNFIKLNCGHEFCKDCIKKSLQNEIKTTFCCAFCRTEIKTFELYEENTKAEFNDIV